MVKRMLYAYLCDSNGKILPGADPVKIFMKKDGTSISKNIKLKWNNTRKDRSTSDIYYRVSTQDGIEFPVKECGFPSEVIKKGDTLTAYIKQLVII